MAQYIDKEKLATKLSVYISNYQKMLDQMDRSNIRWVDSIATLEGKIDLLQHLLTFCNNLEVKDVDFETEWKKYFEYKGNLATVNVKDLAKHFFKLGMQKGE